MNLLVTGCDGYIGAVLVPMLMARGHRVTGLDTGFYREGLLYHERNDAPAVWRKDIRDVTARDLEGFDAVIHLAELSNDPLGALAPAVTHAINHRGTMGLAAAAKAAGVSRFVYASSCSVYGLGGEGIKDETSAVNPLTAYAVCKALCERDLSAMADARFAPVMLRNATAFGASPRMRFDIVVNNLAGMARAVGDIGLTSDGAPWRPLVHVRDIALAMMLAAEAPHETVVGQILNVGSDAANLRVREIAALVAAVFPGRNVTIGKAAGDDRSYRVSFGKIREVLPGFDCAWTVAGGAQELADVFDRIGLDRARFEAPPFTRLAMLTRLIERGDLDADLRWSLSPAGRSSTWGKAA